MIDRLVAGHSLLATRLVGKIGETWPELGKRFKLKVRVGCLTKGFKGVQ